VKSLIIEIKSYHNYFVVYRKLWIAKQKTLAMVFGYWKDSYNDLSRWLQAI